MEQQASFNAGEGYMRAGKVYLVGAGPGDPGLLTIKAMKILENADVVIYDRLVTKDILRLIPKEAEKIYARKLPGKGHRTQDEINEIMIREACRGKIVVRLKGGDPFLFGRGGEEAQALRKAGIEFEVIPGITSALAVPAYAGIPLTHREYASSLAIVTGHEDPTKPRSRVNWEKLATSVDTIVVLMGVKTLKNIVRGLIKGGRDPETSIAIIERGTTTNQRVTIGTLRDILQKAEEKGVKAPAVIVIGDIVKLREELSWFKVRSHLSLKGKTIAITRPEKQAGKLAELISRLGGTPYLVPTIEIKPQRDECFVSQLLNRILYEPIGFLIFMSVNSVTSLIEYLEKLGLKDIFLKKMNKTRIIAIGPKTKREIEKHGIEVSIVPPTYSSEGIVESLKEMDLQKRTAAILCSNKSSRRLPQELEKLGVKALKVPIYECSPPADHSKVSAFINDLLKGKIDIVTFTSSFTAINLFEIASQHIPVDDLRKYLGRTVIAVIGPVTRRTLEELGVKVDVMPKEYTIEAMVDSLVNHLSHIKNR
jgi:uroporphyrinogen III methyltransferase/synthase